MAVTQEELAAIGNILSMPEADSSVFNDLKGKFPELAWTRCDASDVCEDPFESHGFFDLHLIDARDHCVQITADPEQATGILLARRSASA